jgi:hypothetical protein
MKTIKQSVLNTFARVGINPALDNKIKNVSVFNWITDEKAITTELLAYCISWVYITSANYERGIYDVRTDDFDRVRYFILEQDKNLYMSHID